MTLPKAVRYHLGTKNPGHILGSGVAQLPSVELWGGFGFGFGMGWVLPCTYYVSSHPQTLLAHQATDLADLAQLVESCRSTVFWMLDALQGLSGLELTDYLGMTGQCPGAQIQGSWEGHHS